MQGSVATFVTSGRVHAAGAAALGCVLLLARPWLVVVLPVRDEAVLLGVFAVVLAVGAWWPIPAPGRSARTTVPPALALGLGIAVFTGGWLLAVAMPPVLASAEVVLLNAVAAVAEEALFRRLLFAVTAEQLGPTGAVVVTAAVFALAHVPVWGWDTVPLNVAAGLVLSWQRAVTGRWSVPALTHVAANVLALS